MKNYQDITLIIAGFLLIFLNNDNYYHLDFNVFDMKKHFYHDEILKICTNRHLTTDEIFEELKKEHPQVGLSTVYRNVEELTQQGKLKKITNIGKKAVFEKNKGYHIHIYDEENNLIHDVDLSEIKLPIPENFEVSDIDITIKGKFTNIKK